MRNRKLLYRLQLFGLAFMLASCSSQAASTIASFTPVVGLTKGEVTKSLGEPDYFVSYSTGGSEVINGVSVPAPYEGHLIDVLGYGPISKQSRDQPIPGDYKLSLTFINGTLQRWSRK